MKTRFIVLCLALFLSINVYLAFADDGSLVWCLDPQEEICPRTTGHMCGSMPGFEEYIYPYDGDCFVEKHSDAFCFDNPELEGTPYLAMYCPDLDK